VVETEVHLDDDIVNERVFLHDSPSKKKIQGLNLIVIYSDQKGLNGTTFVLFLKCETVYNIVLNPRWIIGRAVLNIFIYFGIL
jgi:hypothetical protein